jgi:EXLDI family protein
LNAQSAAATAPTDARTVEPEFKNFSLRRNGRPPVNFVGVLIGESSDRNHDSSRWAEVRIYRTRLGRYVVEETHTSRWEGEPSTSNVQTVGPSATEDLIGWLESESGTLSPAAQEAVEQAGERDESLKSAWVLIVE